MFENFYFIFIIGFFVGIGFLSLIIFLRKDKTDIKENTDLISLKNHMQSIQQSLQNFNLAQDRIENTLIRGGALQQGPWGEFVLKNILDSIQNSEGIVLIYSQFLDAGLLPIALALEEMGFSRYGNTPSLFSDDTIEKVDSKKFPALKLAYNVLESEGLLSTVLNAAKEVAVEKFIRKQIKFLDIVRVVEEVLQSAAVSKLETNNIYDINQIKAADELARQEANLIKLS